MFFLTYICPVKKNFVLRVIRAGGEELITLDLNASLPEQLQAVVGKRARMRLFASPAKDYQVTEVYGILVALRGSVKMEIVTDTPETADINADLYLEN